MGRLSVELFVCISLVRWHLCTKVNTWIAMLMHPQLVPGRRKTCRLHCNATNIVFYIKMIQMVLYARWSTDCVCGAWEMWIVGSWLVKQRGEANEYSSQLPKDKGKRKFCLTVGWLNFVSTAWLRRDSFEWATISRIQICPEKNQKEKHNTGQDFARETMGICDRLCWNEEKNAQWLSLRKQLRGRMTEWLGRRVLLCLLRGLEPGMLTSFTIQRTMITN